MFVQQLANDAPVVVKNPIPEAYSHKRVRWVITIDADGKFVDANETSSEQKGKTMPRELLVPDRIRSHDEAYLLCDTLEYVLGIYQVGARADRANKRFTAFKQLTDRCVQETGNRAVRAVSAFLASLEAAPEPEIVPKSKGKQEKVFVTGLRLPDGLRKRLGAKNLRPSDLATFAVRLDGNLVYPIDDPDVQSFWSSCLRKETESQEQLECMICGCERPALRTHPLGIVGVSNRPTKVISSDSDVFESYGLKKCQINATCWECFARYVGAANWTLRSEDHHRKVGPLTYIFWSSDGTTFNPLRDADECDEPTIKNLFNAYRQPAAAIVADEEISKSLMTRWYAAGLSAYQSRLVIRDWIDTTIENVRRSLARWYHLHEIEEHGSMRYYGLMTIVHSLLPAERNGEQGRGRSSEEEVNKSDWEEIKTLVISIIHTILRGDPLPESIAVRAVLAAARNGVSAPLAAAIKAYLSEKVIDCPNGAKEVDKMASLDKENRNPGYLCGRLLQVLDYVQRKALPGINISVGREYFAGASTAPRTTFPQLIAMAQSHLSGMSDKPRLVDFLDSLIAEILSKLDDFPAELNVDDQARFCLGFYHQKEDRQTAKDAEEAAKDNDEAEGGN